MIRRLAEVSALLALRIASGLVRLTFVSDMKILEGVIRSRPIEHYRAGQKSGPLVA